MTVEIQNRLTAIHQLIFQIKDASRFEEQETRLTELEGKMAESDFWDSAESERSRVIDDLKGAKQIVDEIRELESEASEAATLYELAREEDDASTVEEVDSLTRQLLKTAEHLELRTLLSGDYDPGNCYLSIHAGAGGTDSCDWVTILQRMFLRWAERNKYKVQILDQLAGEETGLKSCDIHISGPFAYGYLRSEIGVHRLVRVSPFDARGRRHTSFASVDISPEVQDVAVEIDEGDLRVDTYRSSGAGGQHVNVTDSAVRITHIPTGIVVQCQNQRSQHANRAQAMRVLQSRMLQLELKKREEDLAKMTGAKGEIAFGSQIRSYVLHPYKMAKDHRTDAETGNVDDVLDGDLEMFIEAYLRSSARASASTDDSPK